jgi:CBS domain-containing protein
LIAYELISQNIAPLHLTDTGEQALTMMSIYHVKHLPVVEKDKLIGLISDDEIMGSDISKEISTYDLMTQKPHVSDQDHLFDVLSKLAEHKLTVVPVVDAEMYYLGLVNQEDLIKYYANSFSFKEPGNIVVLQTKRINYSLAEISQIVEAESGSILSTFLNNTQDTEYILVTVKIVAENIQGIIASFERYGYTIKGSFMENDYIDTLKERYDALMSFLNV